MQRRGFLNIAGRLSAGIGVAEPWLGAFPGESQTPAARSSHPQEVIALLDEGWSIAIDPDNVGREQSWFQSARPDAKATEVPSITQNLFPTYHGAVWCWLDFSSPANPSNGGRCLLRFYAVDYLADVSLNGHRVGFREGGEPPFDLDVTDMIQPGKTNKLAVRVLNPGNQHIDGIVLAPAEPISQQMQTYGTALCIPDLGTRVSGVDAYTFRSQMTPAIVTSWDLRDQNLDITSIRNLIKQWRSIAEGYLGIFYPLTPYFLEQNLSAAMQFGQPDASHDFVVIFRKSGSPYEKAVFEIQGLNADQRYEFTNADTGEKQTRSGKDLITDGIPVELSHAPESALILCRQIGNSR